MKKYFVSSTGKLVQVDESSYMTFYSKDFSTSCTTNLSKTLLDKLVEAGILKVAKQIKEKVEPTMTGYDLVKEALYRQIPLTLESYIVYMNESKSESLELIKKAIKNNFSVTEEESTIIWNALLRQIYIIIEISYDERDNPDEGDSSDYGFTVTKEGDIYKLPKDLNTDVVLFRNQIDAEIARYILWEAF